MREYAAAVDVGHQHDGTVDGFREAHVGDVAVAQVDLGGAAGPFHDDGVVLRAQPRVRFQHGLHGDRLVLVVVARVHVRAHPAVDHDLGARVAGRFQQHGIEVRVGFEARGQRLQRLRAPDLAAVRRHGAVQRHVLRLERRHAHAAPAQQAAQRRHQRALAGVRRRALHH